MERKSKKELLQVLDQQKEQLGLYEAKLKDVVRAYKSLQKEKAALESGLKAASESASIRSPKPMSASTMSHPLEGSNTTTEGDADDLESLKSQVASVTVALSTVTAEKSRMEAGFQADRKKLMQEKEELEKTVGSLQSQMKAMEFQPNTQVEELKSKLIVEKHEREQEQHNCSLMLRELQTLLTEERRSKDRLEAELTDSRRQLSHQRTLLSHREAQERRIRDLENEAESLRVKLSRAESACRLPQEVAQEQKRAREAEERARVEAEKNEVRVAALEARLAELSQVVGNYDRTRQRDRAAILALKEQLAQLQLQSSLSASNDEEGKAAAEESNLDVSTLMEKVMKFKSLLMKAYESSEKHEDVNTFLIKNGLLDNHAACLSQYQQLKDEFERFQVQCQISKHSHCSNKDATDSNEIVFLKSELAAQKEGIRVLQMQLEDARVDHRKKMDQLQKNMATQKEAHREEIQALESHHQLQMCELEVQMKRQRERSLSILAEKEEELHVLKKTSAIVAIEEREEELAESLCQTGKGEVQLLHYAQELARKDIDIRQLKTAKRQLEADLRKAMVEFRAQEDALNSQIIFLKDEIARLSRNSSREGANLEYLKNVVLSYMLSSEAGSRQHMLNAISAVLQFSVVELEQVKQYNALWWWQTPQRKNSASY